MPRCDEPYSIGCCTEVTLEDCAGVAELRAQYYYPDVNDPRYADCGLHKCLSPEQLLAGHRADPGSCYLFARSSGGILGGYLRLSIVTTVTATPALRNARQQLALPFRDDPFLEVKVVLVARRLGGERLRMEGDAEARKLSTALYSRALAVGKDYGCRAVLADVYVSPRSNRRSLALHEQLGFRALGGQLLAEMRDGEVIHSLHLARPIEDGARLRYDEARGEWSIA